MQLLAICVMALAFGFVGSMPLAGPIALLAVSRATLGRYGDALRVGLGAAAAEGVYAGFAFWGYTTFLARHAVVVPISHGMTAVVLVAVGVRFVVWRPSQQGARNGNEAGTVLLGFSISAINPTLLLTWSAGVAFLYSKGLSEPPALYAVPFGLSGAAGIAAWFVSLAALLKRFGGKLPTAALTWTVRGMGLVLVGLGLWSGAQLVRVIEAPKAPLTSASSPSLRADRQR
jgi:threonine/homoserine/homoserine lactone efflux protein